MKNQNPKNSLRPKHIKLLIADELLDFQKLAMCVHYAESKQSNFVKVVVPVSEPERFQKNLDELQFFYETITDREIKLKFLKMAKTNRQQRLFESSFDFVSLFSGGLDSLSYPLLPNNITKRGLLSHTITSSRMQKVARDVHKKCLPNNHKMVETNLRLKSATDIPLLHVRGVVFLTTLLCLASEYNIGQVVIPENGPFMINYPVSMRVAPTRTTDPAMITGWAKIFENIFGQKIEIQTPFFNYTKSEVILAANKPESIKHTWSCSTSQGISKMCGLCMACFVRILSLYTINQGENLERTYNDNVMALSVNKLKSVRKNSFRILIDCVEFWKYLIHPDLAPTFLDRDNCANLIKKHHVIRNHAVDMYIGLKKCLEINGGKSPLAQLAKCNLEIIDDSILQRQYSQLEKRINNYGVP